jgi:SpoVK/Ycf46/Vps4 family AAA+-type ATPase
MEEIDINNLLNREKYITEIKDVIAKFESNPDDYQRVGGIYIYGETGIGKTYFAKQVLNYLDYDVINYDAGNIRNTSVIENIAKNKLSNKNIYNLLQSKIKKNVILMDEIDGMNNGDKGGINTLIKIIRPKKTKKQKLEYTINSPIICIGNCHIDKKIKELMKVCHVIQLNVPSDEQIKEIILKIYSDILSEHLDYIIRYSKNNLHKLKYFLNIYKTNNELFLKFVKENNIQMSSYSDDTKDTVKKMILNKYNIDSHNIIINDTDRTSVGLLWHENIIDLINKKHKTDKLNAIECYRRQLENICLSDYIDRITFQKQIWEFNEMSSLIKSFYNNMIFHNDNIVEKNDNVKEIRFTKVLTKYSTEYNNSVFLQKMCQKLQMDRKDMMAFFYKLKNKELFDDDYYNKLEDICDINKLEIDRIVRYIDTLFVEKEKEN